MAKTYLIQLVISCDDDNATKSDIYEALTEGFTVDDVLAHEDSFHVLDVGPIIQVIDNPEQSVFE